LKEKFGEREKINEKNMKDKFSEINQKIEEKSFTSPVPDAPASELVLALFNFLAQLALQSESYMYEVLNKIY